MKLTRETATSDTLVHFDRVTGGLKIVSADDSGGFDIEVDGRFAGAHLPGSAVSRPGRINRIIDGKLELPEPVWKTIEYGIEAAIKKNINPEWTLEGGNTAYLSSRAGDDEKPTTATFHCPLEG